MATFGNTIYAVNNQKNLYSVDPTTRTYTLIGNGGPANGYYTIGSTTGGCMRWN